MLGGCEGGPVGRTTIPSPCSVTVLIDAFSLLNSVREFFLLKIYL